jgi:glycosyltransferase involved in cell wall biosynthesis/predicted SAM-dependent methyltransferase
MVLSVITPTHNVKHLAATYASLRAQTFHDWEWVVVPNGAVTTAAVHQALQHDDDLRIKVVSYSGPPHIGAIKRFAFMQGTKDILVELDHDDLLTDDALEQIQKAFEAPVSAAARPVGNPRSPTTPTPTTSTLTTPTPTTSTSPRPDFVYSNSTDFFENGNFHYYPNYENHGWRYRTSKVRSVGYNGEPSADREVSECVAFEPSANALGLIYFAPNHVRAWRASFYREIGGHDPSYPVCDDHELLVRTYLKGRCRHIDKCLYLYRMGPQNTFAEHRDEIRDLTNALYVNNVEALIVREGALRGLGCYDLGAGFNPKPGWTPVDREFSTTSPTQVVADLNDKWPFEDASVLAFRAHDFVEHLANKQHVMEEIHRCLVPGGWALINVPSTDGRGAFQDPTHVSYWNENSFWYYTRPDQARFIRNTKHLFITRRLFTYFPSKWHETHKISYVVAELIAIKGDMAEIPGLRP